MPGQIPFKIEDPEIYSLPISKCILTFITLDISYYFLKCDKIVVCDDRKNFQKPMSLLEFEWN